MVWSTTEIEIKNVKTIQISYSLYTVIYKFQNKFNDNICSQQTFRFT